MENLTSLILNLGENNINDEGAANLFEGVQKLLKLTTFNLDISGE